MEHLFICCLHLEVKCFTKKRGLELSAADLVAQSSEHVEQPAAVIPEQQATAADDCSQHMTQPAAVQPSDHDYCQSMEQQEQAVLAIPEQQATTDHDYSQPMEPAAVIPEQQATAGDDCSQHMTQPAHVPPSDHDYCQPMEQEQPEQQTTTDQPTKQLEQPADVALVSDGDLKLQIEKLKSELSQLKKNQAESERKLKRSNKGLKRRCAELKLTISDLNIKLDELHRKFEIDASFVDTLKKCVSQVPLEIFEATVKRVNGSKLKNYHPAIKRFALNLHTCSAKAYR